MNDLLEGYAVRIELPILWGDMDAFQHVNNLVYLRHFESARIAYLDRYDYKSVMDDTGIGPILKSTDCTYRIPLTYPDRVVVGIRVIDVAKDRLTMQHVVFSEQHQKIAAEGLSVIVCVDYERGGKAPIPAALRETIREIDGI